MILFVRKLICIMIVSYMAKKQQAIRNKQVSYLHATLFKNLYVEATMKAIA